MSDIIANLTGRLRYFEEILKPPGLFQSPPSLHHTDVDTICGTNPDDPLRRGFVSAKEELERSFNS